MLRRPWMLPPALLVVLTLHTIARTAARDGTGPTAFRVPTACLEHSLRAKVAHDSYLRWVRRHPNVDPGMLEVRRQRLIKYTKCGDPSAYYVPASQVEMAQGEAPAAAPFTSAVPDSPPVRQPSPPTPERTLRIPDPKLADLARCLSVNGRDTAHADRCRAAYDPSEPARYPPWPTDFAVVSNSAERVVVEASMPPLATPTAWFHAKVVGPTTMQAARTEHAGGHRFRFSFVPAEAGRHSVDVRLEYFNGTQTLIGTNTVQYRRTVPRVIPPAEFVGLIVPGSPFVVDVPANAALPPAFAQLPVCQSADRPGIWRNVKQKPMDDLFMPRIQTGGCPVCTRPEDIDYSTNPRRCKRGNAVGAKTRLSDGQPHEWYTWDVWSGQDCAYCRYSRDEAMGCLRNKQITVVGDSVGMQLCSYFQCAYHGGEDCHIQCEHRMMREGKPDKVPCFETQAGAGPVYCISFDNFLGQAFRGQGSARGYMIMNGQKDEDVEANVRYSQRRLATALANMTNLPPSNLNNPERVLVIGAGLHDNAFATIDYDVKDPKNPFQRMMRIILRMGYDRIIYILPTATHRYVSWSSDCNQLKQILFPTCMQFVQRYMTNARTLRIHELTRHAIETATRELPPPEHPTVEIVDAYTLSEMRDDNTKNHADMVHFCSEFNRELLQVLMHTICRGGATNCGVRMPGSKRR